VFGKIIGAAKVGMKSRRRVNLSVMWLRVEEGFVRYGKERRL